MVQDQQSPVHYYIEVNVNGYKILCQSAKNLMSNISTCKLEIVTLRWLTYNIMFIRIPELIYYIHIMNVVKQLSKLIILLSTVAPSCYNYYLGKGHFILFTCHTFNKNSSCTCMCQWYNYYYYNSRRLEVYSIGRLGTIYNLIIRHRFVLL